MDNSRPTVAPADFCFNLSHAYNLLVQFLQGKNDGGAIGNFGKEWEEGAIEFRTPGEEGAKKHVSQAHVPLASTYV